MSNLKQWKKYENNGEVYYYLPELKAQVKLLEIDSKPSRAKLDLLEDDINEIGRIGTFNESFLSVHKEVRTTSDLHELPAGYYRHEWGNGNRPNRLEEISIRNDIYFANQKLQDEIQTDVQKFLDSKSIFNDLGIIYKRGILLYGEPGVGKSSFIRHIISEVMPKDCVAIWINSIPSTDFMKKLNSTPKLKIFIVEEITSFNDHSDSTKEMLEFLDGESSPQNSIIFATTNYPQELKKNLADRPSRFDLVLEIKESSEEEAKALFESFLKRKLTDGEVSLTGLCVAHIKDICLSSLMYKLPLQECYENVMKRRKNFKNNFSSRDGMGFSGGSHPRVGRD